MKKPPHPAHDGRTATAYALLDNKQKRIEYAVRETGLNETVLAKAIEVEVDKIILATEGNNIEVMVRLPGQTVIRVGDKLYTIIVSGHSIGEADEPAEVIQEKPSRMVGCEREDGLLNVHPENETCEVCKE